MPYRNKTYVAFAGEDIRDYRMMTAWRANQNIDFNFYDAHDLNTPRSTSSPDTVRRRLRERLANAKQSIVLLSSSAKAKSQRTSSFFYYELEVIRSLSLPVVFVNLNQSRAIQHQFLPSQLRSPYYTISVSYQPKIVMHALDEYVERFASNPAPGRAGRREGPYYYKPHVYQKLGL